MDKTPKLFSQVISEELQAAFAKIIDDTPEVEGMLGIIIYHPQLGDNVDPSFVLAGPVSDPVFLTRAVCRTSKFQQGLIAQLEAAMLQGLQALQSLNREIDGKQHNKSPTESSHQDKATADGIANIASAAPTFESKRIK